MINHFVTAPFFDSSFFDKKLEFVVQGNGPSVVRISCVSEVSIECIFTVELYVLSQGYISAQVPEFQFLIAFEVVEDISAKAGAAEVGSLTNIIVHEVDIEGARFLPVSCAVANACVPGIVMVQSGGGVLYIFTSYIEIANRNVQVNAIQFITFDTIIIILEFQVISAQFCKAEVIAGFSIECILSINIILQGCIIGIKLAKAYFCIESILCIGQFSAVEVVGITKTPAIFIAEVVSITAQGYSKVAELMFSIEDIHVYTRIFLVIFEVHVVGEAAIDGGGVINLTFDIDSHTAIPCIGCFFAFFINSAVVSITHTSVAGPVEVADFLFQVGNANAQVSQFVSVFASQFVQGCSLFSIQLIFFSEHTSDDLSHFITGDVSFAFEGAIRIAFNDALFGQVYYCLVSPVGWGYIRERICSVCGYASGECCYSSECENFFHVLRSL